MMKQFEGKVAIVTGGTSGIGRATAIAYAREGAKVAVTGRREEKGAETIELIKDADGEGLFIQTDVRDEEQVKTMVEKTVETFGRLDFAFNNAGVEQGATKLSEMLEKYYYKVFDTNVKGVWLSMKYQIPEMLKVGGGSIINCSSVTGTLAMPHIPLYVASKHAVIGLTKGFALDYARKNIRINAVAPAAIDTDMIGRYAVDDEKRKFINSIHPIGRIGKPEEIADAVIWLSSEKSSFVTGQTILLDGGYTLQ
jgi:NAD(P)-dependent dehydrogenase (short-subunit alcohol dehydrogenase family)